MILPYNVDRPTQRTPICTYTLMALNIVIYLATVLHANIVLPGEREAWRAVTSIQEKSSSEYSDEMPRASEEQPPPGVTEQRLLGMDLSRRSQNDGFAEPPDAGAPYSTATPSAVPPDAASLSMDDIGSLSAIAERIKSGKATQDEVLNYQTLVWRIEHSKDLFVLDPHPSIFRWLAYWVGAPSFVGFFFSMFLHADLEHVLGNMLFLWIFGRALEDVLGPTIYLMAYMVCGIAATLLFHVTSTTFSPTAIMVPSMGASGAIAGLQGLFAPRFYRTPVRIFYTTFMGARILYIASFGLGLILTKVIGSAGGSLAFLVVLAGIVLMGEDDFWGEFRWPAMYAIGGFFVWQDILPVALELYSGKSLDSTAHWAHIGGFLCGVGYAFLVGLTGEAKTEYLAGDAQAALEKNYGSTALEHAQELLKHKPGDAAALQLMAQAYDTKRDKENALANWHASLNAHLKHGDRASAMNAYKQAIAKHPEFSLPPGTLLAFAAQSVQNGDYLGASQFFSKVYVTFPESPESQVALLRSAQMHAQHMQDFTSAYRLLEALLARYPDTQWRTQAENGLKSLQAQLQKQDAASAPTNRKA